MWCVVCMVYGVWCAVCGVWCVVCGVVCDIMAKTLLDMNSRKHKYYLAISLLVCVRASVVVCPQEQRA